MPRADYFPDVSFFDYWRRPSFESRQHMTTKQIATAPHAGAAISATATNVTTKALSPLNLRFVNKGIDDVLRTVDVIRLQQYSVISAVNCAAPQMLTKSPLDVDSILRLPQYTSLAIPPSNFNGYTSGSYPGAGGGNLSSAATGAILATSMAANSGNPGFSALSAPRSSIRGSSVPITAIPLGTASVSDDCFISSVSSLSSSSSDFVTDPRNESRSGPVSQAPSVSFVAVPAARKSSLPKVLSVSAQVPKGFGFTDSVKPEMTASKHDADEFLRILEASSKRRLKRVRVPEPLKISSTPDSVCGGRNYGPRLAPGTTMPRADRAPGIRLPPLNLAVGPYFNIRLNVPYKGVPRPRVFSRKAETLGTRAPGAQSVENGKNTDHTTISNTPKNALVPVKAENPKVPVNLVTSAQTENPAKQDTRAQNTVKDQKDCTAHYADSNSDTAEAVVSSPGSSVSTRTTAEKTSPANATHLSPGSLTKNVPTNTRSEPESGVKSESDCDTVAEFPAKETHYHEKGHVPSKLPPDADTCQGTHRIAKEKMTEYRAQNAHFSTRSFSTSESSRSSSARPVGDTNRAESRFRPSAAMTVVDVFLNDVLRAAPLIFQPPSAQVIFATETPPTPEKSLELLPIDVPEPSLLRGTLSFTDSDMFNFTIFNGTGASARQNFLDICLTTWDKVHGRP